MIDMCRICLANASRQNKALTKEVLQKISLCFRHEIVINTRLPQTICIFCLEKIEDVLIFRQQIIQNQSILLKLLATDDCNGKDINEDAKADVEERAKLDNKENERLQDSNVKLEVNEQNALEINSPSKCDLSDNGDKLDSGDDDISLSMLRKLKEKEPIYNQCKKDLKTYSPPEGNGQIGTCTNFTCLTCFKINHTQTELLKHYNDEHKSNDKAQGEKLPSIDDKYEVIRALDGCVQYKCNRCEKSFDSKRKINRHTISHVDDRPFLCKLCGRTYKTASEIVRHGRAHNGFKVPCRYQCGYSTVYLGALKEHERRHRTEYMYTCEKCGKGFQVLTWYEQHQNIHTGEKPFICEICGVAFHMDRYLKAHLTTVHPQASSRKRFICVHCSKPCDSKKSLTLHLKEHGITTKFLCDICGKVLSDGSQLKFHKRVHLNVRPYSCSECGKCFARRCNLSLHARTHSAEKAFACTLCERRYTQRATLRRHMRRFHKGNAETLNIRNLRELYP